MKAQPNEFVPEIRELEKTTLTQIHGFIHQKDMRNSDRLLIFSHLLDRYIEARTKIIMSIGAEEAETTSE